MNGVTEEEHRRLRTVLVALQQPVLDRRRIQWGPAETLHVAAWSLLAAAAEEVTQKYQSVRPIGVADGVQVYIPRVDIFDPLLTHTHPQEAELAAQALAAAMNREIQTGMALVDTVVRGGETEARAIYALSAAVFRTLFFAVASRTVL
jgi:hypothetical protein